MSYTAEGTIEIDLQEFFTWVYKNYFPTQGAEFVLGVPRVNKSNSTLEIDFAMATDGSPREWITAPNAVAQWNELK